MINMPPPVKLYDLDTCLDNGQLTIDNWIYLLIYLQADVMHWHCVIKSAEPVNGQSVLYRIMGTRFSRTEDFGSISVRHLNRVVKCRCDVQNQLLTVMPYY